MIAAAAFAAQLLYATFPMGAGQGGSWTHALGVRVEPRSGASA